MARIPEVGDARTMSFLRTLARLALGSAMVFAGTAHLTFAREEFQAQVPDWFPLDEDLTVLGSGVVEIGLGAALVAAPKARRPLVGGLLAAFFVAIFPGNISQWANRRDGFTLDTDAKRLARLPFQPLFIAAAIWSTRAK